MHRPEHFEAFTVIVNVTDSAHRKPVIISWSERINPVLSINEWVVVARLVEVDLLKRGKNGVLIDIRLQRTNHYIRFLGQLLIGLRVIPLSYLRAEILSSRNRSFRTY